MGGGLIQLQTYGAANQYLMGNPQITFWKVVYKRHTNFSMEHIEVPFDKLQELSYGSTTKLRSKVPRHADLISKMYLSFIIPGIKSSSTYSVRLIQNFASSLIVSANLYIGGQSIEKIYGEWIHIYHNLFMNEDKRKMYEDMTGNSKIDSDVTVLGDLREGNKLYTDINFVEDNFGGTLPLELIVSAENGSNSKGVNLIDNPHFYNKVNTFLNTLINYDDIKSVSGYWNLNGDINIQQYKYTNKNRNEIRLSCGIRNIDSEEAEILKNQIRQDYYRIFENNNLNITGSTLLALKMNKYLISSLLNSFILAFFIIFISINILFRSFKLSLISMLPNIIPLLCAGGFMGFIGIELRPATAMTFSIALGIAVDDTIHFLSRFKSEFYDSKNHEKSITNTILTTGRAIVGTTITLGMGFLVLIFSNFKPNYEFGILSTIILCMALLSSLVLLPSIINFIKPLDSSYETN